MDPVIPPELETIRARLVSLAQSHGRGELDDATYDLRRREVERTLADVVLASPTTPTPRARSPRPSWRLVATLVVVVAAIAVGGYAFTGSPSLAGLGAPAKPPATADAPDTSQREIGLAQIAEMVDKLAARLKDKPDDAEGWTMLARSYTVLTRYRDALPAYRHAIALEPRNAGLLADYSDALAAANGGKPDAESLAMIDRALAIDPGQPKALALAGTVAFDRGDYASAVTQWQKIADRLPPESEFHQQVMANIDEARRRGGLATTATAASPTIAGHEALTGTVRLAPALAAKVAPTDTVFVLARAEGARMPLAVQRATVADLPLHFKLDDSMAMTPTAKLSTTPRVVVVARISKSGNAITQPGDLGGETAIVAPGTSGLVIEIAKEVGPR
jgi:cytochrome c-type biogenesis protein CcmH